ncbi:discoidin domain-containing protein [Agarilytica rhodophyticola]|uniref:discoidin domain-containing protein n=1 Tax=Agarilytica rhodophyticola TaxID=1737490 RepID=UPI000B345D9B|nr:discoidin domain-containing protein [Agarilytica rhodophyticola]
MESYDEGGQGIAYNDSDPQQRGQFHRQREGVDVGDAASASDGRFVGWINDGEWLEYTSEIVPGIYDFTLSVADPANASGIIRMLVGGVEVGTVNVPVTGNWTKFEDVTLENVDLSAYSGRHIFRLEFINGSFNLDAITSTAAGSGTPGNGGTSTQLSRVGWNVTASTSRDVNNAIDGIASSRWATRATQRAGQTFTIDLGAIRNVDRIVLDSGGNPNDYPRGYIVRVSDDGINYRDVTSGNGDSAVTDISFAGQTARHIQIEQTGSSNVNWWSIHEVNLYGKN